uniref:GTP-eEF1A C-terminal domain-containing protein n=1 Tax=Strombidium inclinatum TaxID=197538 RepID=A0A7S3ITX9_9SPIT|mmetsp:Transcript_40362/g.61590  ORF Transcript_40362/g.61590 Transcript_40362/m.61590 type:complete len:335 (+) Transcript_40362:1482-2486(+)
MDDCKWQKSRFDEIQTGLTPFLKGCGYKEEDLIYVPISGLSGENMSEKGGCNWYTGPPLIEVLDKIELDPRFPDGPLRIPILDKMKEKDIVIHGKIENGTIKHGDKLCIAPHGGLAQVLGLLDGKGDPVAYATPGENVQIRLNVADDDQVQRGFVLCHREKMMPVTEIFEAEMDVLELLDYKPILSKGYQCIMHAHTFNDEVIVKDIVKSTEITDKGTEVVKEKPQYTKSHTKIICRITPKNPIAIEKFDSIPQMGRFTLRDEGKTICVGRVLKYKPYSKGFVSLKKEEAKSNANGTVVTNNNAKEMVYDMETGEMKPKPQAMDAIAEGDEDEN